MTSARMRRTNTRCESQSIQRSRNWCQRKGMDVSEKNRLRRPATARGQGRSVTALVGIAVGLALGLSAGAGATSGTERTGSPTTENDPDPRAAEALIGTNPGDESDGPGGAEINEGAVSLDPTAGTLSGQLAKGTDHSKNGAVAAFSSYSAWLIGSPAAASDPQGAVAALGADVLNPATAQQLASIDRSAPNTFNAEHGAYRVLAHAGDESTPDEVMVEVAGQLTIAGATRWVVVGGVVKWSSDGWQLVSIAPREVPQPSGKADVEDFTQVERDGTLEGLGWFTFTPGS
jgi:hypothetical protein